MRVITRLNVGGPAWQVSVLENHLTEPEFRTTLVCGDVSPGEIESPIFRDWGSRVVRVRGLGRRVDVFGDVAAFLRLVSLMRRERPDIVHTHTAKAGVLGRCAAIVARVPIRVHTFHGHLLYGYFSPSIARLFAAVERILARRSSALVAVGARVRDDLVGARVGVPSQFAVIAPGVEPAQPLDRAEARRQIDVSSSDKLVVFVGRLTTIKRPDRLIGAFRLVADRVPTAVLVVVGDGELLEATSSFAADLMGRVRFVGWKPHVAPFYAAADVVVLTSDNEGMPVSLIEAAMAGRPCVTTRVGSAAEVVIDQETGFVVESDETSIAHALVTLLSDDDERRRMGHAARVHAESSFGSQRLAEDHRRLYHLLIERLGLDSCG